MSGGADSTALLLGLSRVAPEFGLTLHAGHLHHGLRGAEADADLAFVRDLCAGLGIPLTVARWNTKLRMKRLGLSGQAGLRSLRRRFLIDAAHRAGADAIATAHHADDQFETVLMRLMRGAGLPGLAAIPARQGVWIRPLLGCTRREIEVDLRANGVSWREDSSNQDLRYSRNRIRHQVIPALVRAMAPSGDPVAGRAALAHRVAETASEAAQTVAFMQTWARTSGTMRSRIQQGEIALDSRKVASYPFVAQRTVLRHLWKQWAGASEGLTRRHLDALTGLIAGSRGGARIDLPGGRVAFRDREVIRIRERHREAAEGGVALEIPGRSRCNDIGVVARWVSGAEALRRMHRGSVVGEFFAADGLEADLELRAASADEWFTPLGRSRPVRLGRFLAKQQLPWDERGRPVVLADSGGILWVVGARRAARAQITAETDTALWVHGESHG